MPDDFKPRETTTDNVVQSTIQAQFQYVGFWRRVLANVIDLIIFIPVLLFWQSIQQYSFEQRTVIPMIAYYLAINAYYLFFVVRHGGTPGKLLTKIHIVNQFGNFISIKNALLRQMYLILTSLVSILLYHVTVINYLPEEIPHGFLECASLVMKYGSEYNVIQDILNFLFFLDVLVIVFNKKKRAIHDYIAGTFVIKKQPTK